MVLFSLSIDVKDDLFRALCAACTLLMVVCNRDVLILFTLGIRLA